MLLKRISKNHKTAVASDGTKLKFVAPRLVNWRDPCKLCYLANHPHNGGKRCFDDKGSRSILSVIAKNRCCPSTRVDEKLGHWRKNEA